MRFFRKTVPLLVAFLLMLTQAFGIIHELDSDTHEPDHACELCAHLSNLGNGFSTNSSTFSPILVSVVFEAVIPGLVFTLFRPTHLSRAPPILPS